MSERKQPLVFHGSPAGYAAQAEGIEWTVRPMETPDGTRWRGEARDMATGQVGNVGNSDFWTPEQAMQQCAVAAGVNFWRPWDRVRFPGDWLARYRRDPCQCAADMVVAGWPRIAVSRWCEAVGIFDRQMLRLYDAAHAEAGE